jgi:hypothetical protein
VSARASVTRSFSEVMQVLPSTVICQDWTCQRDALVRGRYGVIEAHGGNVFAVHLRRFPKLISWPEIWPVGPEYRVRGAADRCWVYYNQPRRFPNFLALKYVVTTRGTSYPTCIAALRALDQISQWKLTDALLCDVSNARISDRLLARLGWEPHTRSRWHRNYIKRFYGEYAGSRVAADPVLPAGAEPEPAVRIGLSGTGAAEGR